MFGELLSARGERMDCDHTIIHTGALGDLCLALLFARRSNWLRSGEGVDVLATNSLGCLQYDGVTAEVRHWDTVAAHRLFAGESADISPALVGHVENRRVLSFLGSERAAAIKRLKPSELISINPAAQRDSTRHILAQWLAQTELHPTDDWLTRPAIRSSGKTPAAQRHVVIHPGSGGRQKCWSWPNFRELIQTLAKRHHVTVTLGPVELEQWPDAQRKELEQLASIVSPDLPGLAQLLREADLLISSDSGPAHLAALLGTATLTLFGPTSANVWRPVGAAAHVIQGDPARGIDWGLTTEAVHEAATAIVNGLSFPLHPNL